MRPVHVSRVQLERLAWVLHHNHELDLHDVVSRPHELIGRWPSKLILLPDLESALVCVLLLRIVHVMGKQEFSGGKDLLDVGELQVYHVEWLQDLVPVQTLLNVHLRLPRLLIPE